MKVKKNKFKQIYWHVKEWFALQPDYLQITILIIIGILTVFLAGFFYSSIHDAYLVFIDPPALIDYSHNYISFLFSLMIMLVGLVLAGYVISILTNSLANVIEDVKAGNLPFYGKEHIFIVNYNNLFPQICKQFDFIAPYYKLDTIVILVDSHELVERINDFINCTQLKNIKIHVRFGDVLEYETYRKLSIMQIKSLLILPDIMQHDNFSKDNKTLKIFYTLIQENEFFDYITKKQQAKQPVKALAITRGTPFINELIANRSNSLILSLSPDHIFSSLISISIVDLNFYYLWDRLLSVEDYNIIFIDPATVLPENVKNFDEIIFLQEHGITLGFCRFRDGVFSINLAPIHESLKDEDWLIVLAKDKKNIRFSSSKSDVKSFDFTYFIPQPSEIFVMNICIIGDYNKIDVTAFLDINKSILSIENPSKDILYDLNYYLRLINPALTSGVTYDKIVINLNDDDAHRIALILYNKLNDDDFKKFVFIINNPIIEEQLKQEGLKNTILSDKIVSKYVVQVLTQKTLIKVYDELLHQYGYEFNFLTPDNVQISKISDLLHLKYVMLQNEMIYIGIIKDGEIMFEERDMNVIKESDKIIVLSKGEI